MDETAEIKCSFLLLLKPFVASIVTSVMLLLDVSDDVVRLMAQDNAGRWRHLVRTKMVHQREFVQFPLSEQAHRLLQWRIQIFVFGYTTSHHKQSQSKNFSFKF